jgi:Kef-type K+ transport system membrane component KefB
MPHGADPFLLQLLVIFLWAKIFAELFERISLPAVLGEILAGVVLGPFATALVNPQPSIESLAGLGAVFLLFTVGLEISPKELIHVGQRSLGVALTGIVVPFVLGFVYILIRHGKPHEATFVATAMVATSVGITARIMGDLKVLHTRAAKIILAAAVFDDILGMLLLAMVSGLASTRGIQWVQLSVLAVEAIGFALVMMFFAPRVIDRMRGGLQGMFTPNAPLILSLAICLGLSVAAEKIGMAAIIGAFFAGMAFAEFSPEWNLQPRVTAIAELLTPFFFFVMGAKLHLSAFANGRVREIAIMISILAILSKLVGCGLPMLREGWRTALKVGVGMTPRGEVGLVVALIGLNLGMITESTYAVLMAMVGVTTVLSAPAIRFLFKHDPGEVPRMPAEVAVGKVAG